MKKKSRYLYQEVYHHLKTLIDKEFVKKGYKLPSKRSLASLFKISPLTVDKAYQELIDEGYVYSIEKKGYFVDEKIGNISDVKPSIKKIQLSNKTDSYPYDFSTNKVETNYFPHQIWARLARQVLSEQHQQMLNETDPFGLYDLKVEISKHIELYRKIDVDPNQIVIGSSSTQLLSILVDLLGRDKKYGIENPTYPKIYHFFNMLDIKATSILVDDYGLIVKDLSESTVDVIHVTPSHQYPTGALMSVERRKELLKWAYESKDRFIIEDDYDSEFKYQGKPTEALFGLDQNDKVIYMNTFSKSLAPSFRVAYLVLPKTLISTLSMISKYHRCTVPNFEQYILYKFMNQGYFVKYLNKMSKIYRHKLEQLLATMKNYPKVEVKNYHSGLHVILKFKSILTADKLVMLCKQNGIYVDALNKNYQNNQYVELVIGYASLDDQLLDQGLRLLLEIISPYL